MARSNDEVEALLSEYADLLAIVSGDAYKPRAYEKAARSVGGHHADLRELDQKGILAIPNVGTSIGDKISEYLATGQIQELEQMRAQIPPGVRAMTGISGLGPKKAIVLYRELGISSVEELMAAIEADALADLKGFGKKTQDNILRGIQQLHASGGRVQISTALELAEMFLERLGHLKQVERAAREWEQTTEILARFLTPEEAS